MSLPELQQNPLVQRVIDIFDTDGNGEVDFKGKRQTLLLCFLTPTSQLCFWFCSAHDVHDVDFFPPFFGLICLYFCFFLWFDVLYTSYL